LINFIKRKTAGGLDVKQAVDKPCIPLQSRRKDNPTGNSRDLPLHVYRHDFPRNHSSQKILLPELFQVCPLRDSNFFGTEKVDRSDCLWSSQRFGTTMFVSVVSM
jgi:hypothetical protein